MCSLAAFVPGSLIDGELLEGTGVSLLLCPALLSVQLTETLCSSPIAQGTSFLISFSVRLRQSNCRSHQSPANVSCCSHQLLLRLNELPAFPFPQRDSDDAESSAGLLVGMTTAGRLHLGGPMAASSVRQVHPATTLDRKPHFYKRPLGLR